MEAESLPGEECDRAVRTFCRSRDSTMPGWVPQVCTIDPEGFSFSE